MVYARRQLVLAPTAPASASATNLGLPRARAFVKSARSGCRTAHPQISQSLTDTTSAKTCTKYRTAA
jgi:hypothetical protein